MTLNSPKVKTCMGQEELFNFLEKAINFGRLMPDNTASFEEIDPDGFAFTLKGMPRIVMRIKERIPHSKIVFESGSEKVDFELEILIESVNDSDSSVELLFRGDFSPMMSMMVKKPLTNFINTLASKITTL